MSADPREDLALLRFRIIGEAINPRLTPAERGHLVRELANQAYEHPDGSSWTYSRVTLDRWIRAYREHGLDGLRPPPRADLGVVRRHPELLECTGVVCIGPLWPVSHALLAVSKLNGPTSAGWATCSSARSCRSHASPAASARTCFCSWMTSVDSWSIAAG